MSKLSVELRDKIQNFIVVQDIEINGDLDLYDILHHGFRGYNDYSDIEILELYEQYDEHDEDLLAEARAQLAIQEVLTE